MNLLPHDASTPRAFRAKQSNHPSSHLRLIPGASQNTKVTPKKTNPAGGGAGGRAVLSYHIAGIEHAIKQLEADPERPDVAAYLPRLQNIMEHLAAQ